MKKYKFLTIGVATLFLGFLFLALSYDDTPVNKRQQLLDAAVAGDIEKVRELIAEGVSPNYQGVANGSALLYAAGNEHLDIVKFLIDNGANVNIQNGFNSTPLISAASKGYNEIVQFLIEKGADVTLKDVSDENAYRVALRYGHKETAALIAKYALIENAI